MDNVLLVVVLFTIVVMFAGVVSAVLYWYKQTSPQANEAELSDDEEDREMASPNEDAKQLLVAQNIHDSNQRGSPRADVYDEASNSPKTPVVGGHRKRSLADSRMNKPTRSSSSVAPPKRSGRSPIPSTPDLNSSAGANPLASGY
ncbi:hypothetical protein DIPPA_10334 [Diplonema papillatum]|nr:hypothetical protein DIPPA_05066 [Diplonema papillatum]KAJ9448934.1 hypothetical protein DIPPA_10334 [Diplonema papillatum]